MSDSNVKTPPLILVVDDEWLNRELMEGLLTVHGYRALLARSGQQALRLAADRKPDLILLDVRMPDLTGYAVCERLKDDGNTRHIPVVLVTALSLDDEEKQKAADCGADGLVNRLIPTEELMDTVAKHLARGDSLHAR